MLAYFRLQAMYRWIPQHGDAISASPRNTVSIIAVSIHGVLLKLVSRRPISKVFTSNRTTFLGKDGKGRYHFDPFPHQRRITNTGGLRESRLFRHDGDRQRARDQEAMVDMIARFRSEDGRHLYASGSNDYLGFNGPAAGDDYFTTCRVPALTYSATIPGFLLFRRCGGWRLYQPYLSKLGHEFRIRYRTMFIAYHRT